jgi:hypothetical protein
MQGTQEGRSVTINVKDMSPTKVNTAIDTSTLLSQHHIRKFSDFEDHSNEIDSNKKGDSDESCGDFRNLFVDGLL